MDHLRALVQFSASVQAAWAAGDLDDDERTALLIELAALVAWMRRSENALTARR